MVTWSAEAALLFIILGFEVLDTPSMVIISTIIPLSQSLGLVCHYLAAYRTFYLVFSIAWVLVIVKTCTILRILSWLLLLTTIAFNCSFLAA